jgi:hypothetical protein
MEGAAEMETVIVVQIHLNHPTKEDGEGFVLNQVFDSQPTAQDILQAFSNDPLIQKMPDYDVFGGTLSQCLATFGVPKLNQMNLTDAEGWKLAIPVVQAEWRANIGSRQHYQMNHCFGGIRVMLRSVNTAAATPAAESAKAEVRPAPKVKTQGVKARSNTSRGLPTVDPKTGLEKSPPKSKRQSKFLK